MAKAIQAKYLPPTNNKPSRIKAWAEGGNSIIVSYPHELSGSDVFKYAAQALKDKLNWPGQLVGGGLPNGDYCFVMLTKDEIIALM